MKAKERKLRTRELLKAYQVVGLKKKPRKKLPRQTPPKSLEREYARKLLNILQPFRGWVADFLAQVRPDFEVIARELRQDSSRDRIREAVEKLAARLTSSVATLDLDAIAESVSQEVARYNRIQLGRQLKSGLGVDVFLNDRAIPGIAEGFAAENVALIRSLPQQTADRIATMVTRAVASGTQHSDLAKEIDSALVLGEKRAKFIARDQVGKLYGQVNSARQRELGIEKFIWRTVRDERVRDEHVALEGETFSYPNGHPTEGLPGEPVNCRCYAEPVLAGLID